MKTWLLLDCNYLCYRAWYTFGELQHGDLRTGVVFGVLRDIITIQDRFQPEAFIFCWDCGTPLRKADYPSYKANREKKRTEADDAFMHHFEGQVKDLRKLHLKALGYKNIFYKKGYEADDIIAQIVKSYSSVKSLRLIIVSADHDLYQLLGPRISMFNPSSKKIFTDDDFSRQFGISPAQWPDAKAIAGCSSDSIVGIKGVGEKTACKFISGKLSPKSKAFESIIKGTSIWESNRHLVILPYPDLGEFEVAAPEQLRLGSWRHLAGRLGMGYLQDRPPIKKKRGFGLK